MYSQDNQRFDKQAHIKLNVKGHRDEQDPDQLTFDFDWSVLLDGKTISEDSLTVKTLASNKTYKNTDKVLFEDELHYYYLRISINRYRAECEVGAAFNSSKK